MPKKPINFICKFLSLKKAPFCAKGANGIMTWLTDKSAGTASHAIDEKSYFFYLVINCSNFYIKKEKIYFLN